jgi:aspartate/methionine/tyrosine aminotransferase
MRVDPPRSGLQAQPLPARRLDGVLRPVIPQISALVRTTPGCLSLAQGMVSWGPPPGVADAVAQAAAELAAGDAAALNAYGAMAGDPALLEAIRRDLTAPTRAGGPLDLAGAELLVTAGSNMAFNAIAQVILDPGDEVILPLPWYFNHVMAVQLAAGVPVGVPAGLVPDPDRLAAAITPRTRAIVTVSPANPSGVVIPGEVLAAINRLCAERGLFHISDEAYAAFVHGSEPHHPPGRIRGSGRHTITLHSLSKAYGMAGWRLGHAAVPRQLLAGLAQVQDTVLICPPRLTQRAAMAALAAGPDWLAPRVASLRERRALVLEAVASARDRGLPISLEIVPDGAFYALLSCATPLGGEALVERLLLDHGVAALPGEAFGLERGKGASLLRLSYGMLEPPQLAEAMDRLLVGLRELLD